MRDGYGWLRTRILTAFCTKIDPNRDSRQSDEAHPVCLPWPQVVHRRVHDPFFLSRQSETKGWQAKMRNRRSGAPKIIPGPALLL